MTIYTAIHSLNPCPRCGIYGWLREENGPETLFCEKCTASFPREEWETYTPREKALQGRIDALLKLVRAQQELMEARDAEHRAAMDHEENINFERPREELTQSDEALRAAQAASLAAYSRRTDASMDCETAGIEKIDLITALHI